MASVRSDDGRAPSVGDSVSSSSLVSMPTLDTTSTSSALSKRQATRGLSSSSSSRSCSSSSSSSLRTHSHAHAQSYRSVVRKTPPKIHSDSIEPSRHTDRHMPWYCCCSPPPSPRTLSAIAVLLAVFVLIVLWYDKYRTSLGEPDEAINTLVSLLVLFGAIVAFLLAALGQQMRYVNQLAEVEIAAQGEIFEQMLDNYPFGVQLQLETCPHDLLLQKTVHVPDDIDRNQERFISIVLARLLWQAIDALVNVQSIQLPGTIRKMRGWVQGCIMRGQWESVRGSLTPKARQFIVQNLFSDAPARVPLWAIVVSNPTALAAVIAFLVFILFTAAWWTIWRDWFPFPTHMQLYTNITSNYFVILTLVFVAIDMSLSVADANFKFAYRNVGNLNRQALGHYPASVPLYKQAHLNDLPLLKVHIPSGIDWNEVGIFNSTATQTYFLSIQVRRQLAPKATESEIYTDTLAFCSPITRVSWESTDFEYNAATRQYVDCIVWPMANDLLAENRRHGRDHDR